MREIREFLWTKETYPIKDGGSFLPNIVGYLHEDGGFHPAMLVVPGGGYFVVSPTESRLVADKFYEAGYHTFILTYTVNCGDMRNFLNLPIAPLGTQPLTDISRAISCIRVHAQEWHVDCSHVAACGFSAGAHLTASLAVHYHQPFLQDDLVSCLALLSNSSVQNDITDSAMQYLNRPDAVILSYPVITADSRFWHEGSIKSLTGPEPTEEQLDFYSLEKQVTSDMPPVFLWHTITDDAGPVENSLLFMQSCRNAKVPCELHLFPQGPHGLSTADDIWQNAEFGKGSELCMEPFFDMLKAAALHSPEQVPASAAPLLAHDLTYFVTHWDEIYDAFRGFSFPCVRQKDDAVAKWPELAMLFLKRFGF